MINQRDMLNQELHARPDMKFSVPSRCIHVLLEHSSDKEEDAVLKFHHWGQNLELDEPIGGSQFHRVKNENLRLGWESHTESHAWTLIEEGPKEELFDGNLADLLPAASHDRIASGLITGIRVEVINDSLLGDRAGLDWAKEQLESDRLIGGWMSDRRASVWTTYKPDHDGLIRFLIIGHQLSAGRLGRLVHRLTDIDDYRMMALRGLPRAHSLMRELNVVEPKLDSIMSRLAKEPSADRQEELLTEITRVSARVEHLIARSEYRFSASRAYSAIVNQRFELIREEVQGGHQRITVFLHKTLNPAMRTCEAAERRALSIAQRISRAAHVLNTMVDLLNKKQNQSILKSMEQQSRMQVALQMAVEGLSIVAISYYGTGLVHYALESAHSMGFHVDPTLLTGLSIPVVVLLTWSGVRLAKKKLLAVESA